MTNTSQGRALTTGFKYLKEKPFKTLIDKSSFCQTDKHEAASRFFVCFVYLFHCGLTAPPQMG